MSTTPHNGYGEKPHVDKLVDGRGEMLVAPSGACRVGDEVQAQDHHRLYAVEVLSVERGNAMDRCAVRVLRWKRRAPGILDSHYGQDSDGCGDH